MSDKENLRAFFEQTFEIEVGKKSAFNGMQPPGTKGIVSFKRVMVGEEDEVDIYELNLIDGDAFPPGNAYNFWRDLSLYSIAGRPDFMLRSGPYLYKKSVVKFADLKITSGTNDAGQPRILVQVEGGDPGDGEWGGPS